MKNILNKIKNKFCSVCEVGTPSILLGYTSRGTCLDYVYDNFKIPYSFAWEVYSNEKRFQEMFDYENKQNTKPARTSFLKLSEEDTYEHVSSFVVNNVRSNTIMARTRTFSPSEKDYCIQLFNPISKYHYEFLMINWIKALLELLDYVEQN